MTTDREFDRIAAAWLDLMPDRAPDRVVAEVLEDVALTPQVRRPVVRLPQVAPRTGRLLLIAATVVLGLAMIGAALLLAGGRPTTPLPSPMASPAPSSSGASDVPNEVQHLAGIVKPVGSMHVPLMLPQAVGLSDGSLLVGGTVMNGDAYAPHLELFNPATEAFTAIPLSTQGSTQLQSMVKLADGSVFLGLQQGFQNSAKQIALVFDRASSSVRPATGASQPLEPASQRPLLPPGAMPEGYPPVALADGRTLFLTRSVDDKEWANLYNPATGGLRTIRAPLIGGSQGLAATMPDGRILVVGGDAAIFDPRTETFSVLAAPGAVSLAFIGWLKDGSALLAGSESPVVSPDRVPRPWTFDPATGVFTPLSASADASTAGSWFVLPDGRVLMLGSAPLDGSAPGDARAWILH